MNAKYFKSTWKYTIKTNDKNNRNEQSKEKVRIETSRLKKYLSDFKQKKNVKNGNDFWKNGNICVLDKVNVTPFHVYDLFSSPQFLCCTNEAIEH